MGRKVNSVAGRPPKPPSNLMVGTQSPKSAPATVEAWTPESLDAAAAVVDVEAAAAVAVETTATSVVEVASGND